MPGALDGIRVLDWTIWQQGTSASAILADLGADVIKIEEPVSGDPGRGLLTVGADGLSGYFQALNRGKRSLAIDLKHPKGRELLLRLAAGADVFLSNYRPGVAERLGIGYADLCQVNPGIIFARASGWGREGPEAEAGSFDILGQARGGLMSINGEPASSPKNVGAPVADQGGGMLSVLGILAALRHRDRTGEGQEVDVSLLGTVLGLQSFNFTTYFLTGQVPQRLKRAGPIPFWNIYAGGDGRHFVIGMLVDRGWPDLCDAIGRRDLLEDERFAGYAGRTRHHAKELMAILDETFAERPAGEWAELLNARGIFSALVQNYDEAARDPQALANGYFVDVPREGGPPVRMVNTPIQFSKTPVHIRSIAPELGQHTEEVLLEAGLSWEEITALRDDGAVGPRAERDDDGSS